MSYLEIDLSNVALDATTYVFLDGIVIVRSHRLLLFHSNYGVEYLRGESATDECQSLFKDYKICLDVSRPSIPFVAKKINGI